MPVQPGNLGQILRIDPTQGDVGTTITVRIAPPNPGQFEFNQFTRVALFPDSQGLLTAIQGGTFPSGFVSIRIPSVTVVSPTELRFQIPQAVLAYRQATGVDRFYVSALTPPGWAWSLQPFEWGGIGIPIGFASGTTLGGLAPPILSVAPLGVGPITLGLPAPGFGASIPLAAAGPAPIGAAAAPSAVPAAPAAAVPASGANPSPSGWSDDNLVEPLIDGDAVFTSLWKDLQTAGEFIYLAFWRFNPDLVLDAASGTTIGQFLVRKANQGTTIKILLWDVNNNVAAWVAFFARLGISVTVAPFPGLQLQALITGQSIMDLLVADLRRTRQWHATAPQPQIELQVVPHPDQGMPSPQLHGFQLAVGSHHQKMVIMDQWAASPEPPRPNPVGGDKNSPRLVAYVLGLNAVDQYWDDQMHRLNHPLRPKPQPWHDAGIRVEGPEANRVEQEFIRRWNLWKPASLWPSRIQNSFPNGSRARFLVTQVPTPQIKGALTGLIARARTSIYVEDQYFSNVDLNNDLIDTYLASELAEVRAAQAQSRPVDVENFLQIALVTNSPEVFRTHGVEQPMEAFRYVNFTNLELCTSRSIVLRNGAMLRRPFGADWRLRSQDWDIPNLEIPTVPNATPLSQVVRISGGIRPCYLLSSDPARPHVYVHSKLTIVDDQYLLIGSANYSVRSMDYDSEADLEVDDHRSAQGMRLELFTEHFESFPSGPIARQFFEWHQRAEENATRLIGNPAAALLGNNIYIVEYPWQQPRFDLMAGSIFGAPGYFITPYLLSAIYPLH